MFNFFLGSFGTLVAIAVYRYISRTIAVWYTAYRDGYKERYALNGTIRKQSVEIDRLKERIRFLECDGYRYPNKPAQE